VRWHRVLRERPSSLATNNAQVDEGTPPGYSTDQSVEYAGPLSCDRSKRSAGLEVSNQQTLSRRFSPSRYVHAFAAYAVCERSYVSKAPQPDQRKQRSSLGIDR
jgi:hypothetical protein